MVVDVVIPNPVNAPALLVQKRGSLDIPSDFTVIAMRRTVDLYDQSRLNTGEVSDIRANGVLAAESMVIELTPPQPRP